MILVTVGTQKFPFNRLIRAVDQLAGTGEITEPVFMQIGTSEYKPEHCEYAAYLSKEEMASHLRACDILITHAGAGMIASACQCGKKIIVVPRKKVYGEHIDDHQIEIAEAMEQKKYIYYCREEHKLADAIEKVRQTRFEKYQSSKNYIIQIISEYIEESIQGGAL